MCTDTGKNSNKISIHSLVKRETGSAQSAFHRTDISIHSLVKRETTPEIAESRLPEDFNPLPRKEGDWCCMHCLKAGMNFNPLPRKEGDSWTSEIIPLKSMISIHSLVKRETLLEIFYYYYRNYISIHSLVKRETKKPTNTEQT